MLYGVTAAVLVALAVLPATGWLVRLQWAGALRPDRLARAVVGGPNGGEQAAARTAARRPDDFALQLAAVPMEVEGRTARFAALRARFPDRPDAAAALLRYACQEEVRVGHADDQALLEPRKKDAADAKPRRPEAPDPKANHPEALTAFGAAAADGERMDPQNAYFPLMAAVGHYAAGRDADARAALLRAGTKPHFEDYVGASMRAKWRQIEAQAGGEPGGLARTSTAFAELFPHYAMLRGLARVAVAQAVQAELAGRPEEGVALRSAVLNVGAVMRRDSTSLIGNLVGIALEGISASRPGGAEPLERFTGPDSGEKNAAARRAAYVAYLNRVGQTELAARFEQEYAAGKAARDIINRSMSAGIIDPAIDPLLPLWAACYAVISNTVALVLLACVFALLRKASPGLRSGQPLPPALRWGAAMGTATPWLVWGVAALGSSGAQTDGACALGLALAYAVALVAPPLVGRWTIADTLRGAGLSAGIAASQAAFGAFLYGAIGAAVSTVNGVFFTLPGSGDGDSHRGMVLALVGIATSCAVPLLLVVALAILSRPLKITLTHALARGFEALAGPIACVLLLGYAALAVKTAGQEAKARAALDAMVTHEGRYRAATIGATWPD
jgi:hypothetical protein